MPAALREQLATRARLVQTIRAFFDERDYLEVDTPLLQTATNPDVHIQSIEARVNGTIQYLQTSPEFAMKRLLCSGSGSIYQLCHAFRDEESGRYHRPEFGLLEWYSVGMDYRQLMRQLWQLIETLDRNEPRCSEISYRDCFKSYLDIDPDKVSDRQLLKLTQQHVAGLVASELARDACLDLLMSEVISARFSDYTLVYDYPASQAALARISPFDPAVAERFELFYNQLELANGFGELTDADEQRRRFERDNAQRASLGLAQYPIDESFLAALQRGMPQSSGVALGIDRLLMVLCGRQSIDQVISPGLG